MRQSGGYLSLISRGTSPKAKPGSHFAAKIFMSGDYKAAELDVRKGYDTVRTIRPEGTRQVSSEVFVVGMGKKG